MHGTVLNTDMDSLLSYREHSEGKKKFGKLAKNLPKDNEGFGTFADFLHA